MASTAPPPTKTAWRRKPRPISCSISTIRSTGGRGTRHALAEAKRANKPILLSVGYAACHWCHVMAHESFEDDATAAVMNDLFVNIKVDREERPDIDQIYMSALHLMGEHGGWPLTMFLTPAGEPFWGGTYFPKQSRYGKPAFVDVLREVCARVPRGAAEHRAEPQRADEAACRDRGAAGQGRHRAGAARPGRAAARRPDRSGAWRHPRRAEIPATACCSNFCGGQGSAPARSATSRRSRSRSSASARAASTIISAAASRATRSTSAGWCRISRRCSTTMRSCWSCWRWRIGVPAIRCSGRARRKPSAGSRAR